MTKYQLAKLVELAGRISTRKRVQKTLYLLQAAGFDLGITFRLHHYGPYSAEVAALLDEMSQQDGGVLREQRNANLAGWQSEYTLSEEGQRILVEFESTPRGKAALLQFEEYTPQIRRLLNVDDLWELELGATIACFHDKEEDWGKAVQGACKFKNVPPDAPKTAQALLLAQELVR